MSKSEETEDAMMSYKRFRACNPNPSLAADNCFLPYLHNISDIKQAIEALVSQPLPSCYHNR